MINEINRQKIIRKRLKEYREHENDPYAFSPAENEAIRELQFHAANDIEFLLNELDESNKED